jgi:hypothetical protein
MPTCVRSHTPEDRLRDLDREAGAVGDRAAVGVGAAVRAVLHELVEEVAVGAVDLDAVEPGLLREPRGGRVVAHDARDLVEVEAPRLRDVGEAGLDIGLGLGADGGGGDRPSAVRLQGAVGHAAHVPELDDDAPAGGVDGVRHPAPARDLLGRVDAGRPGVALALLRDLRGFRDQETGAGALGVVAGVEVMGRVRAPEWRGCG